MLIAVQQLEPLVRHIFVSAVRDSSGLRMQNWQDFVQIVLFARKHDSSANLTFTRDPSVLDSDFVFTKFRDRYETTGVRQWLGILSNHPPVYMNEVPRGTCWKNVLIGLSQGELGPTPWRLRPAAHAALLWSAAQMGDSFYDDAVQFSQNARKLYLESTRHYQVRVIQRARTSCSTTHSGGECKNRAITNVGGVVSALRNILPPPLATRVSLEYASDWQVLPLSEQMLRASGTSVLVGACGALLTYSAWLPVGGLLLEFMPVIEQWTQPLCNQRLNSRCVFFGYTAAIAEAWHICTPEASVGGLNRLWRDGSVTVNIPKLNKNN